MSVICPVTGRECPYLKKLDTDVCPREHTCDAVRESYSNMLQKPPLPHKNLIIILSSAAAVIIALVLVFFLVFDGSFSFLRKDKDKAETTPSPVPTAGATLEPTPAPTTQAPLPTASPLPVTTPAPAVLPPVPITADEPTKPVRIILGEIENEIKPVPLDNENNIDVLPNATVISWYEGSYIPGSTGNCIMFGYKHYEGMAGLFYNLDQLKNGDTVTFTLDNGSTVRQIVLSSKIYKEGILTEDVLALENTTARTVLISETGDVDPSTGHYRDLIVVILE